MPRFEGTSSLAKAKQPSRWTAEAELLLCYARTEMDAPCVARAQQLVETDLDWTKLLNVAHSHGLAPLVFWHLHRLCSPSLPAAVMDALREHFHSNTRHNIFLTGQLIELLGLFRAHGIAAVAYKGPTLTTALYGNLALRQFNDLDILLRPADVSAARDVLLARGYTSQHHFDSHAHEAAHLRHDCEYNLIARTRL